MATALLVYGLLGAVALYGIALAGVEYVRLVRRQRIAEDALNTRSVEMSLDSRKRDHGPGRRIGTRAGGRHRLVAGAGWSPPEPSVSATAHKGAR
ncbi:hypothetical protein NLX83_10695 [Allokutzneria sp. A3M-2-11 16]|uniref:hypothetical protein n=1 Tax=Allokutzneria sp. A3M-2-11 16 TaxID=2962043 RepID=UPI0020B7C24B|nr:hypothetical protein [Allokutzneria sp. A3M-2-11 16]MCP3799726.1 hypothetical protein [Allokutzneria sp. A3M-2-11 16]